MRFYFHGFQNIENRVDVYEGLGTLRLKVKRSLGLYGSSVVSWQATPREATVEDFSPAAGTVVFMDQEAEAFIDVNIIDDNIPEQLQVCHF